MTTAEYHDAFAQITAGLATELAEQRAFAADVAWQCEPRPIPLGLIQNGVALGHIAFMGDFDRPNDAL
jgi:hypothetical protein